VTTPAGLTSRAVVAGTLTAVLVVGAMLLFVEFLPAFLSLFVAVLLASAVQPLVARLERRMRRDRAALLVHVAIVALAFGFAVLLLPVLVEQVRSLWSSLPGLYVSLREQMAASDSASLQRMAAALPPTIAVGGGVSAGSLSFALAGLGRLGSGMLTAAAILVLSYSWSVEGERTIRSLLLLLPMERRQDVADLVSAASAKLAGFVRGQVLLCLAVGVLAFVAYSIIGLPHTAALAIMAGVLEAVPMLGPILGAIPAVLVAVTVDPVMALWVGAATVVIQVAENYLLVPRIMDRSVGVNPLVTILAITAFGAVLGIVGALLAIPLAALAQLLLDRFVLGEGAPADPVGRDQTSALRYEAQNLAADIRLLTRHKEERAGAHIDAVEDELEGIAVDVDRVLAERERPPPRRPSAARAAEAP
jgi:predicted PurR-regulated permease PerM